MSNEPEENNSEESENRATDLNQKVADQANHPEQNRVTADEDEPQPTREPTRDQR